MIPVSLKIKMKYAALTIFFTLLFACDYSGSIKVKNFKIIPDGDGEIELLKRNSHWKGENDISKIKFKTQTDSHPNYFWFRGEFDINDSPESYCGVYLDKIKGRDFVYINNRLIGNKKIDRRIDWYLPSHYRIPDGILVKGKNKVIIFLETNIFKTDKKNYGGINSDVFIQPKNDFDRTELKDNFIYKWLFAGMILVFSFLILINIINFVIDRKNKFHFFSITCLLLTIVLMASLVIPFELISIQLLIAVYSSIVPIVLILCMIYFQVIYGVFLHKFNRFIILLFGIFILLFICNIYFIRSIVVSSIIMGGCIICGIGSFVYILNKLNRLKPNRFKFYFIISASTLMFTGCAWEGASYITGIYCPALLNIYLSPIYIILCNIYGARESSDRKKQLDHLYDMLRETNGKKPAKLTITDSSEEKLTRVIDFINENYTSDISREGLAAAININMNYLSSLFNAYTGKKIKEYIHFLRIKEAAKQLKETDGKIIDIAFSVGFENLSTFIRSFKSEMGKTPSEYRESPD